MISTRRLAPDRPHFLGCISPIFPPFFPIFCAFSPSRRGGSNKPQAGTQGQETAGVPEMVVHDLYAQVVERCQNPPKGPGRNDTRGYPQTSDCFDVQSRGVHFSDAGIELTAIMTAAAILPHL
eukprot:COSAG04_NODE_4742_length_1916_cov_1.391855_2_plen_123_part_00